MRAQHGLSGHSVENVNVYFLGQTRYPYTFVSIRVHRRAVLAQEEIFKLQKSYRGHWNGAPNSVPKEQAMETLCFHAECVLGRTR